MIFCALPPIASCVMKAVPSEKPAPAECHATSHSNPWPSAQYLKACPYPYSQSGSSPQSPDPTTTWSPQRASHWPTIRHWCPRAQAWNKFDDPQIRLRWKWSDLLGSLECSPHGGHYEKFLPRPRILPRCSTVQTCGYWGWRPRLCIFLERHGSLVFKCAEQSSGWGEDPSSRADSPTTRVSLGSSS